MPKQRSKSQKKIKDGGSLYKSLKPLSTLQSAKEKAKADELARESSICTIQ
jgi:hypothetical protein